MTGALSGAGHRPKKCESVQQQIKVAMPDFSWDCYTALLQKCCQDNAVLRLIMAQRSACVCVCLVWRNGSGWALSPLPTHGEQISPWCHCASAPSVRQGLARDSM